MRSRILVFQFSKGNIYNYYCKQSRARRSKQIAGMYKERVSSKAQNSNKCIKESGVGYN